MPEFYGVSTAGTVHKAFKVAGDKYQQLCGMPARQTHWLQPIGSTDINSYHKCRKCFG